MGGGCPLRAPCLRKEGLSLTMNPWEAGDPHSRSRPDHHPHRSGGQRHHQSGCSSATRQHPPAEPRMARARGEGARRYDWSTTTGASVSPARWDARPVPATRPCGSGAEIGSHDGTDGTGNATSVQLSCPHWMRSAVGCGYVGTEGLPANRVRDRNRNLSTEDRVGREAVGKTACNTLCGHAVVFVLHVRAGRSDAESQV